MTDIFSMQASLSFFADETGGVSHGGLKKHTSVLFSCCEDFGDQSPSPQAS